MNLKGGLVGGRRCGAENLHTVILKENHRAEDPKLRSQLGKSTYGSSLCTEREGFERVSITKCRI